MERDTDETKGRRGFMIGQAEMTARPLEPALYLVATPIGNLGDITLRALEVLAAADLLACEDTRVTRTLLARYGIRQRPVAYHEHNAAEAGPRLVDAVAAGRSVALVSAVAGKGAAFPIPVTVVPLSLTDEDIESLA